MRRDEDKRIERDGGKIWDLGVAEKRQRRGRDLREGRQVPVTAIT